MRSATDVISWLQTSSSMQLAMTDVSTTDRKSLTCPAPDFFFSFFFSRDWHKSRYFPGTWYKTYIQEPMKKASEKRTTLVSTNFQNTASQAIRPRCLVGFNTWKAFSNITFNQRNSIRVYWLTLLVTFTTTITSVKSGREYIQSICNRNMVVEDQRHFLLKAETAAYATYSFIKQTQGEDSNQK